MDMEFQRALKKCEEASCRSLGRQRGSLEPSEEKMLKEERLSASKGQRR